MSLIINGTEVQDVVYNGNSLNEVICDGVTVLKKGDDWSDKPYVAFIEENGEQFTLQTEVYNDSTTNKQKSWDGMLYYSTDGETWSTWGGTTQLLSSNDGKLFLRGKNNTYLNKVIISSTTTKYFRFALQDSKRIQCHGNIENLLDYETVAVGNHPTMANNCYTHMFDRCTSLTSAPNLPATTLATYCYQYMFAGCTSLTSAPNLPATTLANNCYQYMFAGCTSLTSAPNLPATTLANYCYKKMFAGCSSLTSAPNLPATTLNIYCYQYMLQSCTSLTSAPNLPATTLASSCYGYMFDNCTALKGKIHLPASVINNSYRLTSSDMRGSRATIVFDL